MLKISHIQLLNYKYMYMIPYKHLPYTVYSKLCNPQLLASMCMRCFICTV